MDGMINNFRLDPMGTPYLSNSEDLGGGNKTILIIRFDNNSWQDISITYNQLQCTVATFDRNNAPYVACRDAESKLSTFKKLVTTSEGASTYQRYRNKERIHTATAKTYTLTPQDIDTTITFEVTPIDSNGSPVGGAVKSTGLWIPGLSGEVFCGN